MKRYLSTVFLFLSLFLAGLLNTEAKAEIQNVPNVLSAPLVLFDDGGNPLQDGSYLVTVSLKDVDLNVLYQEEQLVEVANHVAAITIGQGYTPGSDLTAPAGGLSKDIFDVLGDVSVDITVEGVQQSQEVAILGSQPYAFIAEQALGVQDDSITTFSIKNGTITAEDLDETFLLELQSATAVDSSGAVLTAQSITVSSNIGLKNSGATTVHGALQDLDAAINGLKNLDVSAIDAQLNDPVNGLDNKVGALDDQLNLPTLGLEGRFVNLQGTVNSHVNTVTGNPHGVTAVDVGASPLGHSHNNYLPFSGGSMTGSIGMQNGDTVDGVDVSELEERVILLENSPTPEIIPYTLVQTGTVNMCDTSYTIVIESTPTTYTPGVNNLNASLNSVYAVDFTVRDEFGPLATSMSFDFNYRFGFSYDFVNNSPGASVPTPLNSTLVLDVNYGGVGSCFQAYIDYRVYKININNLI